MPGHTMTISLPILLWSPERLLVHHPPYCTCSTPSHFKHISSPSVISQLILPAQMKALSLGNFVPSWAFTNQSYPQDSVPHIYVCTGQVYLKNGISSVLFVHLLHEIELPLVSLTILQVASLSYCSFHLPISRSSWSCTDASFTSSDLFLIPKL